MLYYIFAFICLYMLCIYVYMVCIYVCMLCMCICVCVCKHAPASEEIFSPNKELTISEPSPTHGFVLI